MGVLKEISKKEYILTIKLPILAVDDIDARIKAHKSLSELGINKEDAKLQKVFTNKVPEGVPI